MNGDRSGPGPDEELLLTMYTEHHEPLLNDAMRLTSGDRQQAEALVQDAFLRAWRNPEAFDPKRESAREWLRSVLHGLAADTGSAARPERPAHPATEQVTPAQERGRSTQARQVAEAVRALVPTHRAVLLETHYRDRSLAETAELLGVPVGTVKARLYHALKKLRAGLSERGLGGVGPEAADGTTAVGVEAAGGPVEPADADRADERRTRTSGFDPARLSLGAYVLQKLAPDDERAIAAHLATCADCRSERDVLAALVPLLDSISETDVTSEPAAPETDVISRPATPETAGPGGTASVRREGPGQAAPGEAGEAQPGRTELDEMLRRVRDQRRGERLRRYAAVLALVVLVALVTWVVTSRLSSSGTASRIGAAGTRSFSATDQASGVSATVATAPVPWGSEVRLKVSGISAGMHCKLVAVGLEGSQDVAATWLAGNGTDSVPIPGAFSRSVDMIARFNVETDTGQPLLSVPTS
ncbi:sigma-70 family RNA polymerase sigma factor [Streptomyces sp. NPDC046197]|uniref:sigma-70 family RNA polymerase sigma factor n=1 Tax=Streptomyces sp. NPDC046197 TaxID=3154337 RepID=UPI003400D316